MFGILFYYNKVLRKNFKPQPVLKRPHRKIFDLLDSSELEQMINMAKNERDKLILKILYGTGIRVSELSLLRKSNIKLKKLYGVVRKGKGNKDRRFLFNRGLAEDIKVFIENMND